MIRIIMCFFLILVLFPFLLGMTLIHVIKDNDDNIKKVMVFGYVLQISIFQVIVVPCVFLHISLSIVLWIWIAVIMALVVSICFRYRKEWNKNIKKKIENFNINLSWVCILFILLLIVQLVIIVYYTHYDLDDAYYLGIASDAYQSNRMYQVSPYTGAETDLMSQIRYIMSGYEMYVAAIAKMAGIHPTIVFHSIMPAIHLLLIYIIYSLIADVIFAKNSIQKWIFLSLLSVFQLFGYVSVYTSATFTMFRLWQGKAVLAGMVIPLIVYTAMEVMQRDGLVRQWILVLLVQVVACFYTSMGALIAPILLAILALINAIRLRNAKILLWAFICVIPCLFTDMMYVVLR